MSFRSNGKISLRIMVADKWFEIECMLPHEYSEGLSDILVGLGACGTWIDLKEAKVKTVHGYFDISFSIDTLINRIKDILNNVLLLSGNYKIFRKQLENKNWQHNWTKYFKPLKVGKKILILPKWEPVPSEDLIIIKINPGKGFGTGYHTTTRLALETLENFFSNTTPKKVSLLDVGSGSGILSIAAMKLGAREVAGVENDPLAVENSIINSKLNGIDIPFYSEIPKNKKFDIIISNIIVETHFILKNSYISALNNKGVLILSGILDKEKHQVLDVFSKTGLKHEFQKSSDDWVCMQFRANLM